MDNWRKYFRSANSDIFEVIQNAIIIAASDWPQEFRAQRDQIAEKLFTCQLAKCHGCDRMDGHDPPKEKESEIGAEEVEALTEETQEDSRMVQEVFRIKDILSSKDHQPDSVLFESLKRLQSMEISVDVLKATEIGKAVNGLRKHQWQDMRHLVRALIDGWKRVVDQWVHATAVLTESTPESMNPSGVYNDEGLTFSNQTSLELSKFFDGTDGNRNIGNGSSISEEKSEMRKQQMVVDQSETTDRRSKVQGFFMEPAGKPQKASSVQKKQAAIAKCAIPEESSVRAKLEVAKRKLHERYQRDENAKKQRTVHVMEIQDIPNQSKQQNQKQGKLNSWSRTSGSIERRL